MVKLHKRILRQRDKRKQPRYEYTRYFLEFPAKLNQKIQPFMDKKFEINITYEDTTKQETLNISLTRKTTTTQDQTINKNYTNP